MQPTVIVIILQVVALGHEQMSSEEMQRDQQQILLERFQREVLICFNFSFVVETKVVYFVNGCCCLLFVVCVYCCFRCFRVLFSHEPRQVFIINLHLNLLYCGFCISILVSTSRVQRLAISLPDELRRTSRQCSFTHDLSCDCSLTELHFSNSSSILSFSFCSF
jgi:hypothetical protein